MEEDQKSANPLFTTDGGFETWLVFHQGVDLPYFAAFDLLKDDHGTTLTKQYYRRYLDIAERAEVGFVLTAPTWRASADWGNKLGYNTSTLDDANKRAMDLVAALRKEYDRRCSGITTTGCLGPRGDGYHAKEMMQPEQAAEYHRAQISTMHRHGAETVSAMTITYADEGIGICQAAASVGVPIVMSFTVETDGALPSGQSLQDAIETVDACGTPPAYYMINCAHPVHFASTLEAGSNWTKRIHGVRVNASQQSHAELDESETLDDGDPEDLGARCAQLRQTFPHLSVMGGCCGTDHRHIDAIVRQSA